MRVRAKLAIGIYNAYQEDIIEMYDEDLTGLTDEERDKEIFKQVEEWANEFICISWKE
jgi:hypothetical protein